MRSVVLWVGLVAVGVLLVGAAGSAGAAGSPFVQASGTHLVLDGKPWYLYGGSTYETSNLGGGQSIAAEIALARSGGLNTLRIVNMFDEGGTDPSAPFSESAWEHVDQLLAAMHDAGLHATLDLSAFRNHLQNRELYLKGAAAIAAGYPTPSECAGGSGDDFTRCVGARWCIENASQCTDPYSTDQAEAWNTFLGFVANRVNTVTNVAYRSDPTIAIVSFAGEPNPPNSGEPLKPTTQELTDFYARVFGQWKAYDPNHLVTSGGLLHIDWQELYGSDSGIDYKAIWALPNEDVLSIHDYFARFPATAANDTKAGIVAAAAQANGKPWITEEFGFTQHPTDGTTSYTEADRGDWYRNVYAIQRNPPTGVPSAGVAFWNLGPQVASGSHDVNPNTPATWAVVTANSPDPSAYRIVDLGTLPGGTQSVARAVNDNGQVVGYGDTASGETHAFSWTQAGGMVDLGTLAGGNHSFACGVNNVGQVVGWSTTSGYNPQSGQRDRHAFSWTQAGGMVDLGALPGGLDSAPGATLDTQNALGGSCGSDVVNDNGQVVGGSFVSDCDEFCGGQPRAFSWTQSSGMSGLGRFCDGSTTGCSGANSDAYAVNATGEAVGWSNADGGVVHAFAWTQAGGMVDLGAPGGAPGASSYATAVSDTGQVVGYGSAGGSPTSLGRNDPLSWTPGGRLVDLGSLGGDGFALAVNGSGQVVGYGYLTDGSTHPFSWTEASGLIDLGSLGGRDSAAESVNSSGQVVGWSETSATDNSQVHAFSWSQAGGLVDLGTLGGTRSQAFEVNDGGQAVGYSTTAGDAEQHAALWEPVAATHVVAAAGAESAAVSWLPPSTDSASVSGYLIAPHDTNGSDLPPVTVSASTTSTTVHGLLDGHTYTFAVAVVNEIGPGPVSTPSNKVTPQAGAPPPAAATGTATPADGGTVSTGSNPATTGGVTTSVSVPSGTSGGAITVAQGATSEPAPIGYSFGSTQIDITAPNATATNPLALVFTVAPPTGVPLDDTTLFSVDIYRAEGAGTPQPIPTCNTAVPVDPQPACVTNRQYVTINSTTYIRVFVSAVSASHWNTALPNPAPVSVSNSGYSPATAIVRIGGRVKWTFSGSKAHSATDAAALGPSSKPLFDSGAKASGSYTFGFLAAGTYSYRSTVKGDTMTGSVQVPVVISKPTTNTYVVIWAAGRMTGYGFVVQYRFKPAGSSKWGSWVTWQNGVSNPNATFVPPNRGGTYSFQSRLRNAATGKSSGDSPQATITIS